MTRMRWHHCWPRSCSLPCLQTVRRQTRTLYTIAPVPGSEQTVGPKAILLQQLGVER
jgi:hypothetical protein